MYCNDPGESIQEKAGGATAEAESAPTFSLFAQGRWRRAYFTHFQATSPWIRMGLGQVSSAPALSEVDGALLRSPFQIRIGAAVQPEA